MNEVQISYGLPGCKLLGNYSNLWKSTPDNTLRQVVIISLMHDRLNMTPGLECRLEITWVHDSKVITGPSNLQIQFVVLLIQWCSFQWLNQCELSIDCLIQRLEMHDSSWAALIVAFVARSKDFCTFLAGQVCRSGMAGT